MRPGVSRIALVAGAATLLVAQPAAAAGLAVSGIGAAVGFLAATWALLATRGPLAPEVDAPMVWLLGGAMVGTLGWAGRHALWRLVRQGPLRRFVVGSPSTDSDSICRRAPTSLPSPFERDRVLDDARRRFVGLQAAWDAGDIGALRGLTTPDMLEELLALLDARGQAPNRTDVVTLNAELLCIEEFGADYLASIEFSGLIRESADAGAVPFRELWMLASPKDDAGDWRLARQQALL